MGNGGVGEPDELDLIGGVEVGDGGDKGCCGGGVVEDEDEVGLRLSNKEESCFYCF
jgi:hypothetical protein